MVKRTLILIPTYNERENIRPLVSGIKSALADQKFGMAEILFIDDSSPDGTADIIRRLQHDDPSIHLLTGKKAGLGRAYIRGMQWGLQADRYDTFVMMDADLSHDPADIPRLLRQLDTGADYVIGSRYISGGRVAIGYSWRRQLQSRCANIIAATLLDARTPLKDLTAGFKAIRVKALGTVPLESLDVDGYVFQVCLLYQFIKHGFRVAEVPTIFHPRAHGASKLGWRDIIEFLLKTYQMNPSARLQQAVRFATVGAAGTVVNIGILVALVRFVGFRPQIAYLAALEGSIISNFLLNHLFTFRRVFSGTVWYEPLWKLAGYNLVSLFGAGVAWAVFTVAIREFSMHYVVADLLGIICAMSWNYVMSARVIWRIVDEAPPKLISDDLQEI